MRRTREEREPPIDTVATDAAYCKLLRRYRKPAQTMASESKSSRHSEAAAKSAEDDLWSVPPGSAGSLVAAEVAELRDDPPPYLRDISLVRVPVVGVVGGRQVLPLAAAAPAAAAAAATGPPWEVTATITISDATDYSSPPDVMPVYTGDHPVRLIFNREYPLEPPAVHFIGGILHHFQLDDGQQIPAALVAQHARSESDGKFELDAVLNLVARFLVGPLHPCRACTPNYVRMVAFQKQKENTIKAYAAICKHPKLFEAGGEAAPLLPDEWISPPLQDAVTAQDPAALWGLMEEVAEDVFAFDLFTDAFCEALIEEVDAFSTTGLPQQRPNSMNRYGLIINEIGLEPTLDKLQKAYLQPITTLLFGGGGRGNAGGAGGGGMLGVAAAAGAAAGGAGGAAGGGGGAGGAGGASGAGAGTNPAFPASNHVALQRLDRHHSFIVRYKQGEDAGLDMHTDDSDVTFNVCLGKEFTGAGLTFCGSIGRPGHRHFSHCYKHIVGRCVVHLGTRRHGADDIRTGERLNLIVWNKSDTFRKSSAYNAHQRSYQQEGGEPDPRCLSYTHDRDYEQYKPLPPGAPVPSRAWCPPEGREHEGGEAKRGRP